MNKRSQDILAYIQRFQRDRGYPPTIREIGDAFQIASTNGVRYHLQRLEREGHCTRTSRLSRGIALSGPARPAGGIRVLGRVAAGQPILAEESFEGRLEPDEMFGDHSRLFALRVRGDSMVDAGILDGDYVIVRQQETAVAGETVVALIEDEATVKYYQPRGNTIELVPANPNHRPQVVDGSKRFQILGVVKGVMRTL
jgi:repressor LexA